MLLEADKKLPEAQRTIQVKDNDGKTPLIWAICGDNLNLDKDLGDGKTQRLKMIEMYSQQMQDYLKNNARLMLKINNTEIPH